jgi:hypothetical protein
VTKSVADVKGVKLAGLLFDAGPQNSPVLLRLGTQDAHIATRPTLDRFCQRFSIRVKVAAAASPKWNTELAADGGQQYARTLLRRSRIV